MTTTALASVGAVASQTAFAQVFGSVSEIITGVVSSAISEAISANVREVLGATMSVAPEKVAVMTGVAVGNAATAAAGGGEASRMVTSHDDGSLTLWDLREGRQIKRLENLHNGPVNAVSMSENGGVAVSAGRDGKAQVVSSSTGKVMTSLSSADATAATAVAVSASGKTVVTGHDDGSVRVWDAANGNVISQSKPSNAAIGAVALSKDETKVLVGDAKGQIVASDAKTGKAQQQIATAHGKAVTFIEESPSGDGFVTAGADGMVKSWKAGEKTAAKELKLNAPVTSASLDPKSDRLAVGDDKGGITVVDLKQSAVTSTAKGAEAHVGAVAFGGADNVVHTVAEDGIMNVVDVAQKKQPTRVVTTTDGWAAVDGDSGAFVGDGDALAAVQWGAQDLSFELDQFGESHYEPAVLAMAFEGQSVEPVNAAKTEAPKLSVAFSTPPIVTIADPEENATTDSESYEVVVEAGNLGGGIKEVRLFHNDRMVAKEVLDDEDQETFSHTFEVKLTPGDNKFRTVALSRDMIESKPAKVQVAYSGAERKSTLHVVTIGINAYRNPALALNYGVPDAMGIEQFFASQPRSLFKDIKTYKVLDKQATKPGIRATLEGLKGISPDDVLVVYLAGHGDSIGETWYFMPYDVVYPEREDHVREKGITSLELEEWISEVPAQKVVMLMDACKSGAALTRTRGFEERKALSRLSRASGMHIIAAAAKDQFAVEFEQLGHGAFTYTLLDAMKGAADEGKRSDGIVSIREINRYIEDQLPELSEQNGNPPQFPVISSRGTDFPLAVKV
ncbi:MAG TPA: caspase family protein [Magnetovibrio sp.]